MKYTQGKKIFVWKNFIEWKPIIESMFSDILTTDFIDKIRQNENCIEGPDDGSFEELTKEEMSSIITLEKITDFRQQYSHIRMYHGCRPVDVQIYYRENHKRGQAYLFAVRSLCRRLLCPLGRLLY